MPRDRSPIRFALLAAIVAALLAPTGVAFHLSAGAEDTAGLSKAEPPADTDEELWDRGTDTGCAEPEGARTLTADGFCGELVYNQGTEMNTTSPPDQAAGADEAITVDLQFATYVGLYGTTACEPWCNSPGTYDAVHEAGASVGLTPTPGEVDDGGTQAYGGNLYAVSPMQAYDAAGQGWLLPVTDTSFVAFVTNDEGDPVDEDRLSTIVTDEKNGGGLDPTATAKVCAFTPEAHLGTHAPDAGRCEVELDWMGTGEDENEPCEAETYVCGQAQPAWRGTTMCPMWHAACYLSDAWNSAHHFAVWHGVVAPSPPDKCGAAEPGFDTSSTAFLAHDLDIYEPPSDDTPAQGVPFVWDEASENVPGLGPLRDGRAPDVADTPAGENVTASPAVTSHEPEPNADEWMGILESSHEVSENRTLTDCQTLATGEEEADPWVNVIDAHVTRTAAGFGTPAGAEPEPDHQPRPSMRVTGHVGLFTDVEDDGDYEQAPGSEVFSIEDHGAYPILWDHHAAGEGCSFRSGTTIGDLATGAGYADPTGLAITLRLTDGVLSNPQTGETRVVAEPTAVVMLSEGLDQADPVVQDAIDRAAGDRPVVAIEDAFQPQCGEPTGGFTSSWQIAGEPLEGDGLAAAAIVTVADDQLGGGDAAVPASPVPLGSATHATHVWWDVDPFEPRLD
ncbi:hypothetical protein BRD56_05170 [Thermoplasmatales archaeon SW_10_69_26]|nr:MAG: hypothetical protein BRD56_05170 [Thermoplasmatales archaeon SW_10_69_26]